MRWRKPRMASSFRVEALFMSTASITSLRRRWQRQQLYKKEYAMMNSTTRKESLDETHIEIAAFAALVRQSSEGSGEADDDNASLVSLDEEKLGLILRIEDEPIIGDAHDDFVDRIGNKSVNDDEYPNDDFDYELREQDDLGRCHFLMARIRANPSLSIATVFMGVLTTYLWTDERFRFIMKVNHNSNGNNKYVKWHDTKGTNNNNYSNGGPKSFPAFPAKALLGIFAKGKGRTKSQNPVAVVEPPYDLTDFKYMQLGQNRILTYWEEVVDAIEQSRHLQEDDHSMKSLASSTNDTTTVVELWTNISTWGPCYPRALPQDRLLRVKKDTGSSPRNWTFIVQANSDQITDEDSIVYPAYKRNYHPKDSEESLGGLCRPGFIIIGQGKCGTSSLYHYLTGHPRILPAKEKQIHYFRYHKSQPLSWYYSHFPTIESFLGRGALMTGEASPGYMPYPSTVKALVKRLSPDWKPGGSGGDGVEEWKVHARSLPKIIAIVRDPISRARSSYKYNYIEPAMKKLRSGRGIAANGERIPGRKSEKYYHLHHLFSFEELAYAELAMLKECLESGGRGERWTYNKFGKWPDAFFYDSIQRRNNSNSTSIAATAVLDSRPPPLIHLDEACYTETKSKTVPRAQWKELANDHPNKILALPNLQLTQSIIGRGVYALPLEWWYEVFSLGAPADNEEEQIHVVCTEVMAATPTNAMNDVTKFLGLPEFDFTNVTSVGRYNVGGHRGYDSITKSHDDDEDEEGTAEEEEDSVLSHEEASSLQGDDDDDDLLAVSDALMNELTHFYKPYNERLFQLIGKRCPWT